MNDVKKIIADNIADLRKSYGMTQLELAEKLNYSDKAVSKWERGESIPEVVVLMQIAELFQVTLDYLVKEHEEPPRGKQSVKALLFFRNHASITEMSIVLVWLVAALSFVIFGLSVSFSIAWLAFVYAAVVSCIVWLILNSIWFSKRRNFLIISLLMWTLLLAVYLSLLLFEVGNIWLLFILGIPGEVIILLWSRIEK